MFAIHVSIGKETVISHVLSLQTLRMQGLWQHQWPCCWADSSEMSRGMRSFGHLFCSPWDGLTLSLCSSSASILSPLFSYSEGLLPWHQAKWPFKACVISFCLIPRSASGIPGFFHCEAVVQQLLAWCVQRNGSLIAFPQSNSCSTVKPMIPSCERVLKQSW